MPLPVLRLSCPSVRDIDIFMNYRLESLWTDYQRVFDFNFSYRNNMEDCWRSCVLKESYTGSWHIHNRLHVDCWSAPLTLFTVVWLATHLWLLLVGLFFIVPCTDQFIRVDLRTVSFDIPPQEVSSWFLFLLLKTGWKTYSQAVMNQLLLGLLPYSGSVVHYGQWCSGKFGAGGTPDDGGTEGPLPSLRSRARREGAKRRSAEGGWVWEGAL